MSFKTSSPDSIPSQKICWCFTPPLEDLREDRTDLIDSRFLEWAKHGYLPVLFPEVQRATAQEFFTRPEVFESLAGCARWHVEHGRDCGWYLDDKDSNRYCYGHYIADLKDYEKERKGLVFLRDQDFFKRLLEDATQILVLFQNRRFGDPILLSVPLYQLDWFAWDVIQKNLFEYDQCEKDRHFIVTPEALDNSGRHIRPKVLLKGKDCFSRIVLNFQRFIQLYEKFYCSIAIAFADDEKVSAVGKACQEQIKAVSPVVKEELAKTLKSWEKDCYAVVPDTLPVKGGEVPKDTQWEISHVIGSKYMAVADGLDRKLQEIMYLCFVGIYREINNSGIAGEPGIWR